MRTTASRTTSFFAAQEIGRQPDKILPPAVVMALGTLQFLGRDLKFEPHDVLQAGCGNFASDHPIWAMIFLYFLWKKAPGLYDLASRFGHFLWSNHQNQTGLDLLKIYQKDPEAFFAKGITLRRVNALRFGAPTVEMELEFMRRAERAGLIQRPKDLVSLATLTLSDPPWDYEKSVDDFIRKRLDLFFSLKPSLRDAIRLKYRAKTTETEFAIMDRALSEGLVRSPKDFIRLVQLIVGNPSKEYRVQMDRFVARHEDTFFRLNPTLSDIKALINSPATHDWATVKSLRARAIKENLTRSPEDFLSFSNTGLLAKRQFREEATRFASSHLDDFVALGPSLNQIRKLWEQHPEIEEISWLINVMEREGLNLGTAWKKVADFRKGRDRLIHDWSLNILDDEAGPESNELIKRHGPRALDWFLSAIEKISITSEKSSIKTRKAKLALLREVMDAGDLRRHIPDALRKKDPARFQIVQARWELKDGQEIDPTGQIGKILETFRTTSGDNSVTDKEVEKALQTYLRSARTETDLASLSETLYACVAQEKSVRASINLINLESHEGLEVMEGFFEMHGPLYAILEKAFAEIPLEDRKRRGAHEDEGEELKNTGSIVTTLTSVWGRPFPLERKDEIIAKILGRFNRGDIERILLPREDLPSELKERMRNLLEQGGVLPLRELADMVLGPVLGQIRGEMEKFGQAEVGHVRLKVRPVKGIAHGMYGLTTGVCTGDEIEIWTRPTFFLFAIIDEDRNEIVGYVQALQRRRDRKKGLYLIGINPSHEFTKNVDVEQLYNGIVSSITDFVQSAGFEGIYIPTDPYVNSNRARIQKLLERKGQGVYRSKKIRRMQWDTYDLYSFNEVYVAWEKTP